MINFCKYFLARLSLSRVYGPAIFATLAAFAPAGVANATTYLIEQSWPVASETDCTSIFKGLETELYQDTSSEEANDPGFIRGYIPLSRVTCLPQQDGKKSFKIEMFFESASAEQDQILDRFVTRHNNFVLADHVVTFYRLQSLYVSTQFHAYDQNDDQGRPVYLNGLTWSESSESFAQFWQTKTKIFEFFKTSERETLFNFIRDRLPPDLLPTWESKVLPRTHQLLLVKNIRAISVTGDVFEISTVYSTTRLF
jgi:hypothetical protein